MKPSTKVDYDQISATYDDVRAGDVALINYFLRALPVQDRLTVLEIGCGTGNYADILQRHTAANVHGVDPSSGMLTSAQRKNPHLILKQANVTALPYANSAFDFVYMVDVIHHISDLDRMFSEIKRVLNPGATACIVTQSHAQIDARPITRFFPETAVVDKHRYPSIAAIIAHAEVQNLQCVKRDERFAGEPVEIDDEFLALVRAKGYSMLHLISDSDYEVGLGMLERALADGPITAPRAGETAVWIVKREAQANKA